MTAVGTDAPASVAEGATYASTRRSQRSRKSGGLIEARSYDFRRPNKLSREHVRVLQMVLETFTRKWATLFTSSLRAVCTVDLSSIQQLSYDEYISTLPATTAMFQLSLDPVPGAGILQLSVATVMTAVDHMLGGSGTGPQPERSMTDVESAVVRGIVERLLGELAYSLEALVVLHPVITDIEYNPQFSQAAAASDLVLTATFDIHAGTDESTASLCLPFSGIFPYLERTISAPGGVRDQTIRENAARSIVLRLKEVPVEVSVRFLTTTVRMPEVLGLDVGDVLPLRHAIREPLEVTISGIPFAHAVPGSEGNRLACLIVNPNEEMPT